MQWSFSTGMALHRMFLRVCQGRGRNLATQTIDREAPLSTTALPASLSLVTIWGANTGVGKTLASVGLANATRLLQAPFLYIKPVQTGFPDDSDARLVATASGSTLEVGHHAAQLLPRSQIPTLDADGASTSDASKGHLSHCKVVHAWAAPVSPHLAVRNEGRPVPDEAIVSCVVSEVHDFTQRLAGAVGTHAPALGLVETAGGVCSPAPSGRIMCDVLRPLRLPCLLVGDPRLGGISSTISAYESLLLRGYDVDVILIMDPRDTEESVPSLARQIALQCDSNSPDQQAMREGLYGNTSPSPSQEGNADALRNHLSTQVHRLGGPPVVVVSVPGCLPPTADQLAQTHASGGVVLDPNMQQWLQASSPWFLDLTRLLQSRHEQRLAKLAGARQQAMAQIWWPFTQHASLKREAVQVVDSRCGEQLRTFQQPQPATQDDPAIQPRMEPLFDAASSWWTQTVTAELQPELSRAVAYAAGRYLHVMSPQVATQASLEASFRLLQVVGGDWARRVFFSDDGSTAIEIALKMAFRKYLVDRVARGVPSDPHQPVELKVVGLENAYHGDTLGAMDCVAPSVFNAPGQAPWYRGRGLFLDPPYLAIAPGGQWRVVRLPAWLAEDPELSGQAQGETWPDLDTVTGRTRDESALSRGYRHHIERVLQAHDASGTSAELAALIIEPLVQGAGGMLVVDPQFQRQLVKACRARHMPVIFDEVMAGLFRLGANTAASLLRVAPDIACYAKLMTAGVVPGAATLATEEVFNAFQGDSKLLALLHGHSYTAFPVGCATTIAALDILTSPTHNPNLCSPAGLKPTCPTPSTCTQSCGRLRPMWNAHQVAQLSNHPLIEHVMVVGTVFAAKLRDAGAGGGGYGSSGAVEVVTRLRDAHGVYARPLGDVVYLMVTPTTRREKCDQLLIGLTHVLEELYRGPARPQDKEEGIIV